MGGKRPKNWKSRVYNDEGGELRKAASVHSIVAYIPWEFRSQTSISISGGSQIYRSLSSEFLPLSVSSKLFLQTERPSVLPRFSS